MNIVNILGINDDNTITVQHNHGSIKDISLKIDGNSTILQKLDNKAFNISTLLLGGKNSNIKYTIPRNAILFNSIGIAEVNQISLKQMIAMMEQVSNPVINHPIDILKTSREEIVNQLSEINGVIVPKCLKLNPTSIQEVTDFIIQKDISFPFLFRPLREHGIQTLLKINNHNEMDKLHRFAFDGINKFYVTSFLNFISNDHIYRKMRFLIIGNVIIPRHLILSESWQIHTQTEKLLHQQQIKEEKLFLRQIDLSVGIRLMAVKKTLKLDYFGIDCAIGKRGNLLVFEANPFSMIGLEKTEDYHQDTINECYNSLSSLIYEKSSEISR